MPRSSSKSAPAASQDVASIVAAVLAAMGGSDAASPAVKPAKVKGSKQAQTPKPRTISDPTRHASTKQVWFLCSKLFEAHYGSSMPKPLTMGDVQAVLDDLA